MREALASRRACTAVSELLKSAPFCALIILKLRTFTTFFVLLMSGNNPESELYICLKSIRDKFVYRAAKRRNPNFVCNHPMCRQMSLKTPKRKLNTSCENLYDPSSSMAGHSTDVPDSNGQLPRRWMPAVSSNVALAHPNDDDDQAICH